MPIIGVTNILIKNVFQKLAEKNFPINASIAEIRIIISVVVNISKSISIQYQNRVF